ncbi:MAG: site-2 protease family protein [Verrucomicrobia bacterium]|nr:site-2 protease family protein [Verrucomicrobiota bacterium]
MGLSFVFVILAALGLGILVFIHELGHYWVARRVGIKVEAFSIGFGRTKLRWIRDGVEWRIGWLPFGGYVRMAGMDKQGEKQPYEVEGGFFHATPFDRIKVAIAGPIVNIVFALLIFTLIWALGGREKSFADFTQRVGWIDPHSALYELGLRPGDIISQYDGYEVHSAKDHLYAAMFSGDQVLVKGYRIDYLTATKVPFEAEVTPYAPLDAPEGLKTLGVLKPAQYLLYTPKRKDEALVQGSPLLGSGIEKGDRLFWADGELLFSHDQLIHLLNAGEALVTYSRGGKTALARLPRYPLGQFLLSEEVQQEFEDWHYGAGVGENFQKSQFISYNLSAEGVVEGDLKLFDRELEPRVLQKGDRILAIDGEPVLGAFEIFKGLQTHKVNIIVQRRPKGWKEESWKVADADFDRDVNWGDLEQLASQIGIVGSLMSVGEMVRLHPIVPVSVEALAAAEGPDSYLQNAFIEQRKNFEKIADPQKRKEHLKALDAYGKQKMLGIHLRDRMVDYNPNPFRLFSDVAVETWRTFSSLLLGYLNPKWLSGPVGIVQVMHYGWTVGLNEALFWLGVISLNLGIFNLLPVPVLDGGHICFALWEKLTRRRMRAETMEKLVIPFVVLLIAFFVFATYQDLSRIFRGFF